MEAEAPTAASPRRRPTGPLAAAYWLVLAGALFAAWSAPRVDWDLLAYVAAAEDPRAEEPAALLELARSELETLARPEHARRLQGFEDPSRPDDAPADRSSDYQRRVAADPAAFAAQLGFYRGRLLYLGMIRAVHALGPGLARSVLLVSLLGGLLFGVVLFVWLASHLPGPYAPLVGAVALLLTGAGQVMAMTTPDMAAAALVLTGAWLLVERRRPAAGLAVLVIALLVRDDHAPLVAALVLASRVPASGLPQLGTRAAIAGLASVVAAVLACRLLGEVHPWWATWRHTFVEYMAFPLEEAGPADPGFALGHALRSVPKLVQGRPAIVLLLAAAAVALARRGPREARAGGGLALAAAAAWLVHFAAFPADWERLLLPYAALVVVGFAAAWRARGMPWADDAAQPMSDQASP